MEGVLDLSDHTSAVLTLIVDIDSASIVYIDEIGAMDRLGA